jgi:hypothetical protein
MLTASKPRGAIIKVLCWRAITKTWSYICWATTSITWRGTWQRQRLLTTRTRAIARRSSAICRLSNFENKFRLILFIYFYFLPFHYLARFSPQKEVLRHDKMGMLKWSLLGLILKLVWRWKIFSRYRKTPLLVPGVGQFSNANIYVFYQLIV